MGYNTVSFEKQIKENIRNYSIRNLFADDILPEYLDAVAEEYGVEVFLTDRHGEEVVRNGDFEGFTPDVVREPGEKLRICERTVGHLYIRYDKVWKERLEAAKRMMAITVKLLTAFGTEVYMHRESAAYMEELEKRLEKEAYQNKYGEKEDILTGTYNKNYLENKMNILDRSEVVPIAVINMNINDWKFVNDNYGDEMSDCLIQISASIIKMEAKPEYIIGRAGGDSFLIFIPMAEDGEAEDYCKRVQEACLSYDDVRLAPSLAAGIVYKNNVEEHLRDKISDAEYEMFNNKLEIKHSCGYQERLKKGLNR